MHIDTETGTQRTSQAATGRSANQCKRSQIDLYRASAWSFIDHDIDPVILHSGIQVFLHDRAQPVNLIDKKHVVLLQRGQYPGQISRLIQHRPRRDLETNPQLVRYNIRQRRLSQPGRPMQKHMIQRLLTHAGSHDEHLQVLHHLRLSAEVTERKRPKHVLVLSLVFRHPGIPYIKIIFHIHVH